MDQSIYLKADSNKEFFLIHGYTGSTKDFRGLPEFLHKNFHATVRVMQLPGHGTQVEDLDHVAYNDFLEAVEKELKAEIAAGKDIILGGLSFGAQLALYFAARYPVDGVFAVCVPYRMRFPFQLPGLFLLGRFKKYWKKDISHEEKTLRNDATHYQYMHANGITMVRQANRDLERTLSDIASPLLLIHSKHDPIGHWRCTRKIEKQVSTKAQRIIIFKNKNHNIFYSENHRQTYEHITAFFHLQSRWPRVNNERVAAIVPAYNEAERIGAVLDVLSRTKKIHEIIVIDDNSTDGTYQVASQYPKVRVLRNTENYGKSHALDRGVRATDASILFFCDADLMGLEPSFVEAMITPIEENTTDMFIGIRSNSLQRVVHLFALNSGERALRRELWEQLPPEFKHRYRVEAGLNFIAQHYGKGFISEVFPYYQTVKEQKYGFIRGTMLRWWMNFDVGAAYFFAYRRRMKKIIQDHFS